MTESSARPHEGYVALPVARRPDTTPVRGESAGALIEALAAIAAAGSVEEVARAAVAGVLDLTSARGGALGVQDGEGVRLRASAGYDCDAMAVGTRVPFDAGLPITDCVRTGRTVVRGPAGEPAWVAVPLAAPTVRGALLVSLRPGTDPDVTALETLGSATAQAMHRAVHSAWATDPVASALRPPPLALPAWLTVARHVQSAGADPNLPGGDVIDAPPSRDPDVGWLFVGDACGSGPEAAIAAHHLRHVVRALASRDVAAPDQLLVQADEVLRAEPTATRFITSAAVRLRRTRHGADVQVASAGHPPALLWRDGMVTEVGTPGPPLNLSLEPGFRLPAAARATMLPGDLLLLYTDGFVDRGTADCTEALVDLFTRASLLGDPATVVDVLVDAMTAAAAPPRDDLAIAVIGLAP